MLCSSPMSASTVPNTESSLLSLAGIIRPHIAIRVRSPSVFKDTVLPPVFGPVITSVSNAIPSSISVGTTFCGSISGWRASLSFIFPLSFNTGVLAFIL